MNATFNHWLHIVDEVDIDAAITAGDFGVLLVMTGWVYATYKDDDQLSDLVLGTYEYDGAGYSRKALTGAAWAKDAANDRSELTASATSWAALGAGSNPAIGSIVYWDNGLSGVDTTIVPVAFHDQGGYPLNGTGLEFKITWDAQGIYQHRSFSA